MRRRYPKLVIEPTGALWRPVRTPGQVAVHLQWIDPALLQSSLVVAVKSAFVLSFYVFALRLTGVRTVWTIHNPIGKSHNRRTLDRVLRTALATVCSQFVVLNRGAAVVTETDLYPPVRQRFRRRVHIVPMPMAMSDHGVELPISEARTRLESTKPGRAGVPGRPQSTRPIRRSERPGGSVPIDLSSPRYRRRARAPSCSWWVGVQRATLRRGVRDAVMQRRGSRDG